MNSTCIFAFQCPKKKKKMEYGRNLKKNGNDKIHEQNPEILLWSPEEV